MFWRQLETYNNILASEDGPTTAVWAEVTGLFHGWSLGDWVRSDSHERNCNFLPERTKECLLCFGFASNTFWHIEMGSSRQEESPTVTGFLGMSKLFFLSVVLSFRITTLHLTQTVKYNESGRGWQGSCRDKNHLHFSEIEIFLQPPTLTTYTTTCTHY